MITIVGIADGKMESLTVKAYNHIGKAKNVYVQSLSLPIIDEIEKEYISFDEYYKSSQDFDSLKNDIAESLVEMAGLDDLTFCALGDVYQNEIAYEIIKKAKENDISIEIIGGAGCGYGVINDAFINSELRPNGIKQMPACSFVLEELSNEGLLIYEIDSIFVASEIKLKLIRFYDYSKSIYISNTNGTERIELEDLDRQDMDLYGYDFCAYIPPSTLEEKCGHGYLDLKQIMEILRSENGCPWDRKETHESLMKYLIEESYEAFDTVKNGDMDKLYDELGDVLLQVVFHAQIGYEHSEFDSIDVTTAVCNKMINRHPHVFSNVKVDNTEQVMDNWEEIKAKEKGLKSYSHDLIDVPKAMPALLRSQKVQKRAAKCGFDWDDYKLPFEKVYEELLELKADIENGRDVQVEMGDVLFAVSNLARHLKVDAEIALYNGIDKFIDRFTDMENMAKADNKGLKDISLGEMDEYWDKCKQTIK